MHFSFPFKQSHTHPSPSLATLNFDCCSINMSRFNDEWVIDRTLFEYVNGGSCACCGFNYFLPNGVDGLIQSMSDLETDAATQEISASANSPWPPELRQQIWADRLRLRHKLKQTLSKYRTFWNEHGEAFSQWCHHDLDVMAWKKILQLPRSELSELLRTQYNIHSAFRVVLDAIMEQVACFKLTNYPCDARGSSSESEFEKNLMFDRRGGFTLPIADATGVVNEHVVQIWLDRCKSLGGPKLLDRGPSTTRGRSKSDGDDENDDEQQDDDESGGADDGAGQQQSTNNSSQPNHGFRSDRRLIRLLIARYWADVLIQKFLSSRQTTDVVAEECTGSNNQIKAAAEAAGVH